jgi:cytochrome c peroxidase
VVLCFLISAGCKKAGTFGPRPAETDNKSQADKTEPPEKKTKEPPKEKKPLPLPPGYVWQEPTARAKKRMAPAVPIRFIALGTTPAERKAWAKLKQFWTPVQTPATPLGKARSEVHIQVPLGLADPMPNIPASNPPTVGKWALGKSLFFDDTYLWPASEDKLACATCHKPGHGFSRPDVFPLKTPTLINCVYKKYLFWDGRARALEEVIQRTLEDEREPVSGDVRQQKAEAERRHVWGGVVQRLRRNKEYSSRFLKVFGTPPTQDAVGKALATYMRTILAGDSLYDRAARDTGGERPQEKHYLKLLDGDMLRDLERESSKKTEVAKELLLGQRTFYGQGRCARCHSGANFTDGGFHNIGVGDSSDEPRPGKETGRFVALPVGLKDPWMIGAYKTPTLRCLPQTAPYFHDGRSGFGKEALSAAVTFYARKEVPPNPHLDPILADDKDPPRKRDLKLDNEHIHALVVFLRALDGTVDDVVTKTKAQPEGVDK